MKPKNTPSKKVSVVIPDTSIIIEGLLSKNLGKKLKPKKIIVHEAVLAELEAQANKRREIGFIGLEELKKLNKICKAQKIELDFKGSRPNDFEIKYAKSGEIDALIRELANKEKATLITADRVQSLVAESKGISVVFFQMKKPSFNIPFLKYFDKSSSLVSLKERQQPLIRQGFPNKYRYKKLKKAMSKEEIIELSRQTIELAKFDDDSHIVVDKKPLTILKIKNYTVNIIRNKYTEIIIERHLKIPKFSYYKLNPKVNKNLKQGCNILIIGQPGSGKSTFIKSLSAHMKNKVFRNINHYSDIKLSYADYFVFDELHTEEEFNSFLDKSLSKKGVIGITAAKELPSACQKLSRYIAPEILSDIIDFIFFLKDGKLEEIYKLKLTDKNSISLETIDNKAVYELIL